jgi:CRP/FNR family transcriptional regulator, cyclic AMP receptor protein
MPPLADRQSIAQRVDKHKLLSTHPFFRTFARSIIDRLVSHAITRRVKKGTVLFRKGDPGANLYAVCAGSVRISVPSAQGHDAILNLILPGELFGEIALLDGGARTADAIAMESSELMVIERRDFIPLIREHPDVAMQLIEVVCARLRRTSEQVEDIVFLGLPERLAKALLQLHSRSAASTGSTIRITQRDLSQMIGVSRESTNKLLRDWQRRGWLKLGRGGLTVLASKALADFISGMPEAHRAPAQPDAAPRAKA